MQRRMKSDDSYLRMTLSSRPEEVNRRSKALPIIFRQGDLMHCPVKAFEQYLRQTIGQRNIKPATPTSPALYNIMEAAYAIEESRTLNGLCNTYETQHHVAEGLHQLDIVLLKEKGVSYASLQGILKLTKEFLSGALPDAILIPQTGHKFHKYIETGVMDDSPSQELLAHIQEQQRAARNEEASIINDLSMHLLQNLRQHDIARDNEDKYIFNVHRVLYMVEECDNEKKERSIRERIQKDLLEMQPPPIYKKCPKSGKSEYSTCTRKATSVCMHTGSSGTASPRMDRHTTF